MYLKGGQPPLPVLYAPPPAGLSWLVTVRVTTISVAAGCAVHTTVRTTVTTGGAGGIHKWCRDCQPKCKQVFHLLLLKRWGTRCVCAHLLRCKLRLVAYSNPTASAFPHELTRRPSQLRCLPACPSSQARLTVSLPSCELPVPTHRLQRPLPWPSSLSAWQRCLLPTQQ
jgi:hypothetical protein